MFKEDVMVALIKAMILEEVFKSFTLMDRGEWITLGIVVAVWLSICAITLLVINGRPV